MTIPSRADIKQQLTDLLKKRGPLKTSRVYEALSTQWGLSATDKKATRGNRPLYQNEIRWARQELAIAGVIDRPSNSGRALWRLASTSAIPPEQYEDEGEGFDEGAVRKISVNAYERSKKARDACLKAHGFSCIVCGFNFESVYGAVGKGCIHVHHLVEISGIGKTYKVNPVKDLLPICPNCHYMAHRRKPAYTIEELKDMVRASNSSRSTPFLGSASMEMGSG